MRDAALGNSEPLLGGARAVGLRAPPRRAPRPRALPRRSWPRCCAPRRGRSSACTGCGCGSRAAAARAPGRVRRAVPALWFLPEWWGSGDPLPRRLARERPQPRQRRVRRHPRARAAQPLRKVTIAPVEVGTLIGRGLRGRDVAPAPRARGRRSRWRSAGFAWFVLVAAMTEAGFAGNQRYLIVTTAVVCVLGGMGAVRVLQGVEWLGRALASAARRAAGDHGRRRCCSASLVGLAHDRRQGRQHGARARRARARGLPLARPQGADRRGRRAASACSPAAASSAGPSRPRWSPTSSASTASRWAGRSRRRRGSTFRTRTVPDGPLVTKPTDDRFRLVGTNGKWRLLTVPPDGAATVPRRARTRRPRGTAGNVTTKDAAARGDRRSRPPAGWRR